MGCVDEHRRHLKKVPVFLNPPIHFSSEFCANREGRSAVQVTSDPTHLLGLLGSLLLNDGKNSGLDRAPVFFSHLTASDWPPFDFLAVLDLRIMFIPETHFKLCFFEHSNILDR